MQEEILGTFLGELTDTGVVIKDRGAREELERRGYGEADGRKLVLKDYEALFLCYAKKLELKRGKKAVSFKGMVEFAFKRDPAAWTRFLIYRDLRSRGYVSREGFGFGVDFRVYDRGEYGSKPAKYVIFGINEGTETTTMDLAKSVEDLARMGKETILAVIERRGEVIYYKMSKAWFGAR